MPATLARVEASVWTTLEARVLGWGAVRAWPERLDQYRKQPAPMAPKPFSPSLLRHSEDQTVAALWATCAAAANLGDIAFAGWGVVAGPCLMGRGGQAASLARFAKEGPWGISPHTIPHHSLHAVSGTISQIFQTHGPNFGVGNGPRPSADAWLTAATLLSEGMLPGLWLVIVGHKEEYLPAFAGSPASRVECEAVSLALGPASTGPGTHLRISTEDLTGDRDPAFLASLPVFALGDLTDELRRSDASPAGMWRIPGMGWIEIETRM